MTAGENFIVACLLKKDEKLLFTKDEWFFDEEIAYMKFIRKYFTSSGELPKLSVLNEKFEKEFSKVEGVVSHYYEELKQRYVFTEISRQLPLYVKDIKKNPIEGLGKIRTFVNNIDTENEESKDVVYSEKATDRFERYKERVEKKGIVYLPYGDEVLDSILLGYEKTDLITMGGRAGVGKSWWIIHLVLLLERYMIDNDLTGMGPILLVTNEMSEEQFQERMDSVRFKLPYGNYTRGLLTKRETDRYERGLKELEEKGSNIILLYNTQTLADMDSKIAMYKPVATFIDGSYLMEPQMDEGYAKTVFITRNLKGLCKKHKRPIINTTQLRKKSGKQNQGLATDGQDEFYHGSYTQDSDLAIRGFQTPELVYDSIIAHEIVKGRRVETGSVIHWKRPLTTMQFEYVLPTESYSDKPAEY